MTDQVPRVLYVAGPMSGLVDWNYPAFHAAAAKLRAVGYDARNPADPDLPGTPENLEDQPWEWYMKRGLRLMLECDGVALLPGWENSRGARIERALAVQVGMFTGSVPHWLALGRSQQKPA